MPLTEFPHYQAQKSIANGWMLSWATPHGPTGTTGVVTDQPGDGATVPYPEDQGIHLGIGQ